MSLIGIGVTILGGGWFLATVSIFFGIATVEFVHLAARREHRVFGGLMLLWMLLFIFDEAFPSLRLLAPGISFLLIVTLGWALVRFRQGTPNVITGFAITIAGGLYLGWSGGRFIALRNMTDGLFWTLTLLLAVWSSDTLAYLIGTTFGRTLLIPDVSPRKTWEGYLGAILGSTFLISILTLLWRSLGAGSALNPLNGAIIGLLISVIGPLGDLVISTFKRYARVKDSSQLIPGHGGVLDRIDVLLLSSLIGYHYIFLCCQSGTL